MLIYTNDLQTSFKIIFNILGEIRLFEEIWRFFIFIKLNYLYTHCMYLQIIPEDGFIQQAEKCSCHMLIVLT